MSEEGKAEEGGDGRGKRQRGENMLENDQIVFWSHKALETYLGQFYRNDIIVLAT